MYAQRASNVLTTAGQMVTTDVEIIDGEPLFVIQYGEGADQLIEFDVEGIRQLFTKLGSILGVSIAGVA
ncbi:hypothetical protein SEA_BRUTONGASTER_68 [Gordonia phage BrutonGaster]|uniref:Uncharacterized protein n=1 Tax=Gordonia phage BrutonGaster TaxID=2530116 RepID=A0A482JH74_9CAUD|nr:hypothetical protein HOV26_gp114 [Gordonia phage BrutonGaster]QBP33285.1 hypothetical protein SEA_BRUTONGASTER_68 [Gordonia phage BrutonGaster]